MRYSSRDDTLVAPSRRPSAERQAVRSRGEVLARPGPAVDALVEVSGARWAPPARPPSRRSLPRDGAAMPWRSALVDCPTGDMDPDAGSKLPYSTSGSRSTSPGHLMVCVSGLTCRLIAAVGSMEVRRGVIGEVHLDHDSVELADSRHPRIIPSNPDTTCRSPRQAEAPQGTRVTVAGARPLPRSPSGRAGDVGVGLASHIRGASGGCDGRCARHERWPRPRARPSRRIAGGEPLRRSVRFAWLGHCLAKGASLSRMASAKARASFVNPQRASRSSTQHRRTLWLAVPPRTPPTLSNGS